MGEIFEFSQLLMTVLDFTKVYKFRQEFCQLGSSCSPNDDVPVRLTMKFLLQWHSTFNKHRYSCFSEIKCRLCKSRTIYVAVIAFKGVLNK